MRALQRAARSPYMLAFLVGLYPIAFSTGNNWFMFSAWQNVLAVTGFSLLAFAILGCVIAGLRLGLGSSRESLAGRIFAAVAACALVYLLRPTLLALLPGVGALIVLGAALALVLACVKPRRLVPAANAVLASLCLLSGLGVVWSAAGGSQGEGGVPLHGGATAPTPARAFPRFVRQPNVYYLVPDSYPSDEALRQIFSLEPSGLGAALASRGFSLYPDAFSNYMHTVGSMLSTFSMDHHYYRGRVGNFEILGARRWIVGANPVVSAFRDNGYRVWYSHQSDYLFSQGCFVDSCTPSGSWGHALNLLVADGLKKLRRSSLDSFESRLRLQVSQIVSSGQPHFLYLHMTPPHHSHTRRQSAPELAAFRSGFGDRVVRADQRILAFVDLIAARDPTALVVVAADHGAWGLGSYGWAAAEVLAQSPDHLIALDHLGILLAIRWPLPPPDFPRPLRSTANLFRYVFGYLTEDPSVVLRSVPDDGYLTKGIGAGSRVFQALTDGRPMTELQPVGLAE